MHKIRINMSIWVLGSISKPKRPWKKSCKRVYNRGAKKAWRSVTKGGVVHFWSKKGRVTRDAINERPLRPRLLISLPTISLTKQELCVSFMQASSVMFFLFLLVKCWARKTAENAWDVKMHVASHVFGFSFLSKMKLCAMRSRLLDHSQLFSEPSYVSRGKRRIFGRIFQDSECAVSQAVGVS